MLGWFRKTNEAVVALAKARTLAEQSPTFARAWNCIPREEQRGLVKTPEGRNVLGGLIMWASHPVSERESASEAAVTILHTWHLQSGQQSDWCSICRHGGSTASVRTGPIDLAERRKALEGTPYGQFIGKRMKESSVAVLLASLLTVTVLTPPAVSKVMENLIDDWQSPAYDPQFWQRDSAEVFDAITESAADRLAAAGVRLDDAVLFDCFQGITVNYAYLASSQPAMRRFIGIE